MDFLVAFLVSLGEGLCVVLDLKVDVILLLVHLWDLHAVSVLDETKIVE